MRRGKRTTFDWLKKEKQERKLPCKTSSGSHEQAKQGLTHSQCPQGGETGPETASQQVRVLFLGTVSYPAHLSLRNPSVSVFYTV